MEDHLQTFCIGPSLEITKQGRGFDICTWRKDLTGGEGAGSCYICINKRLIHVGSGKPRKVELVLAALLFTRSSGWFLMLNFNVQRRRTYAYLLHIKRSSNIALPGTTVLGSIHVDETG